MAWRCRSQEYDMTRLQSILAPGSILVTTMVFRLLWSIRTVTAVQHVWRRVSKCHGGWLRKIGLSNSEWGRIPKSNFTKGFGCSGPLLRCKVCQRPLSWRRWNWWDRWDRVPGSKRKVCIVHFFRESYRTGDSYYPESRLVEETSRRDERYMPHAVASTFSAELLWYYNK